MTRIAQVINMPDCIDVDVSNPKERKECVSQLYVDGSDQQPIHYDYSENHYTEDWDIPFEITEKEHEEDPDAWVPMMNYFYPLPNFKDTKKYKYFDDKKIKKALDRAGNVTLVERLKALERDAFGLALTGGGMDFSWDIVKGYVFLGYLPPAHFCRRLPKFADMSIGPDERTAIEACVRTAEVEAYESTQIKELMKGFPYTEHRQKEVLQFPKSGRYTT